MIDNIKEDLFRLAQGATLYMFTMFLVFGFGTSIWTSETLTGMSIAATAVFFSGFGAVGHRMLLAYRQCSTMSTPVCK